VSAATTSEFQGTRVLITGGNSGIGRAAAEAFAARGARVAIVGRDQTTLAATKAALGANALAIRGDVANLADLDRMAEDVRGAFGGLDVLIASAGISPILPVDQVTETFFDQVIGTNLKGVYFTVQKCIPLLADGAAVVLLSSSGAHLGVGGMSVYAASKAGVRSLARTFSAELLPRRIRVNVVIPGPVKTQILDRLGVPTEVAPMLTENIRRQVPLQRLGEPHEVVGALLFLASSDSTFIVGAELRIDGGLTTL